MNPPASDDPLEFPRLLAKRALHAAQLHRRGLTAALLVGLGGFAVTAFGIAPMAPDAADLPKRVVTENVAPSDIQSQLEALAEHELELYRTDLTRSSDTADSLLRRLNVDDPTAADFLRNNPTARKLLEGRGGKMVQVQTNASGELVELTGRYPAPGEQAATSFTRLRIQKVGGQLQASSEILPLTPQMKLGSGTIQSSLFAATDDARIPDSIANQLAEVFATDINFHRELRRGDTFSVIYEALTADGEPITWNTAGRVLAAEFVNDGKVYSAVWFKDGNGKGGYYGLDGRSKRRAFLSSPLAFSRITSGFSMRMHPILNSWKQHKGVDYGAPTGTPVRTVGDGVVDFAGWQNGYGNVVEVRHNAQRSTLYAHLSKILVSRGQRVEQGDRIGAVGMTGWATGPHLHFEVKIGGVQTDPLLVAKSSEVVALSDAAKARFAQLAGAYKEQLQVAETIARNGTTYYGE
jgi:murein DD-endopeptidase MepM/ murein hydrolase activator NlpD